MKKLLYSYARLFRYQFWKLDSLRYLGTKFSCPICLGHFRAMKPFVGSCHLRNIETDHYTENAICPRCHSDIRQRFLVEFMKARTNLFKTRLRVIHFAPEISIYKMLKSADLDYVAADINPSQFAEAVFADITNIPFGDDEFDCLICIHVLEHIKDDSKALKEIFRVLKPNGFAILAVPTYGEVTFENSEFTYLQRESYYGTGDHMRLNGLDFADKIRSFGFVVDIVSVDDLAGNFVDRDIQSPHTESDKYLFYCTKPIEDIHIARPNS